MTSNHLLLILDDDPVVLTFLGEVGRGYHYDVALTQSVDELRACYDAFGPSLIVLDLQYAHGDGIEVMSFLKQHGCEVPIVLISGFDSRVLETARRVGLEYGLTIVDALVKPIRPGHPRRRAGRPPRAGGRGVGRRSARGDRPRRPDGLLPAEGPGRRWPG